jgi:tetratricopeptide (TPR) repeat protein
MMSSVIDLLARAAQAHTPTSAARYYRQALNESFVGSPHHIQASEGLGRALEKLDPAEAITHYLNILEDDIGGLHHYAYERFPIIAEQVGDYKLALRVIHLALQRRVPTSGAFRRRAWRIAEAAGLPRPFVPLRLFEWQRDDRRTELFWYYAEMARDRGAWSLAARRYNQITPDSNRYAEAQVWRGHCLEQLLNVEDAITAYEQATIVFERAHQRDPVYATVIRRPFDRLIALYELRGELDRAMEVVHAVLKTARKLPPRSWWKRAERIAAKAGAELNRAAWEEAFTKPLERDGDALPVDHRELGQQFRTELRRLQDERMRPHSIEKDSHTSKDT